MRPLPGAYQPAYRGGSWLFCMKWGAARRVHGNSGLIRLGAGLACLAVAAVACTGAVQQTANQPVTITVAAASDLQFALEEMVPLFQQEKGVRVQLTMGSSGNIAQQIENGAPIDVFLSADQSYIDRLQARGLIIDDTKQLYALGHLALAGNRASGTAVTRLEDLVRPGIKHIAIANPEIAPYGRAARQALQSAGIWEELRPKLVYGENVRQALQFVQTGDADAGIVALSIVGVPEVAAVPVDEELYDPLRQALAVVRGTHQEDAARQFAAFVTGPQGRNILRKHGFGLP